MAEVLRSEPVPFRCMEIRGGSRAIEERFRTPGLDAWIHSLPHEGAAEGGDVHYVSRCGGGVITRMVVADVSGHGEHVAEFSAALRSLLQRNINTKSQTRLVEALNRQFGEAMDSVRFATAVVATYLANLRTLTICNAGHPRPLWYRAETRTWEFLEETTNRPGNLPLGLDDQSPYAQFTVELGVGDLVVFYTDALTESRSLDGGYLMEDGLLELSRGLDPDDAVGFGPALLAAVDRHRGGLPAADDVTLLTLAHNGEGPRRPSLGETLDVLTKLVGLRSF